MNKKPKSSALPSSQVGEAVLAFQDARVFKAGNSLAVRIPRAMARHIDLDDGAAVELAVDDRTIYVRRAQSRIIVDLIDRITPQNIHEPILDELVGAERW